MRPSAFANLTLAVTLGFNLAACAQTQLAISSNDGKMGLVNGVATVPDNPSPDTLALIDLSGTPRLIAEIEVPGSYMGPPSNVAISPDGRIALVSSAFKLDAADRKKHVPDNRVAIVDLRSSPPRVVGTVQCGAAPSGISFNREGTLALVANRADGTLCVLKVAGDEVKKIDTITIGPANSGPSHPVITPDGKMALVTKDSESAVAVLTINGDKVEYAKRDFFPGTRPYGIAIAPDGRTAVVAMVGRGVGDSDTIASVDLTGKWPRVVEHLTIGQQAEGLAMSADGKWVAATVVNSSNKAKEFPWYSPNGKVVLVRVDGTKLTKTSEAPVGAWCQGAAFSGDGKTLLVQNPLDKQLQVFSIDAGGQLKDTGQKIGLKASPVGIRAAGAP